MSLAAFNQMQSKNSSTSLVNCTNDIDRPLRKFPIPHFTTAFAQPCAVAMGNYEKSSSSANSALVTLQQRFTITDSIIENVTVPCFNFNGEPRLFLPQFIIMVQEKGITMDKLNDKCEELMIQCIQASVYEVEAAKKQQLVTAEVKSLGLIFKSDAERLCKQLFQNFPILRNAVMLNSISVYHHCFGKGRGTLYPDLYMTENASCVECRICKGVLSLKAFVGHTHQTKEIKVRHWGFDSENWRAYLALDKQAYAHLSDKELAVEKMEYDAVKSKFVKGFSQFQLAYGRADDVIPPPPAHLSMGNFNAKTKNHGRSSPILAHPESVPKPDDEKYNEQHVPNVRIEPVNKCMKLSGDVGSNVFHTIHSHKMPTLAGTGPLGIESLDRGLNEEWELMQDLMNDKKIACRSDQFHCLERFTAVKKKYLNSIKTLSEALNKANQHKNMDDLEWNRKLNRIKCKKRALKRALADHPEPQRKQFIQLRYQLELQQEKNRQLEEEIANLRTSTQEREEKLQKSLNLKCEEASSARIEVDELRERYRRLQRLQAAVSSNATSFEAHKELQMCAYLASQQQQQQQALERSCTSPTLSIGSTATASATTGSPAQSPSGCFERELFEKRSSNIESVFT